MPATDRTIFSFIVDNDPIFLYEGWHLARSLIEHCGGDPSAIVVQCTPEVPEGRRAIFRDLGCRVQQIARFGDGRHCNKLSQLDNLKAFDFDRAVLLDTDMIVLADLRDTLAANAIQAKVVDLANPSLDALREIAAAVGMAGLPPQVQTDGGDGMTCVGNCNGGFYVIPKSQLDRLSVEWRRWATWLLDNNEPLKREGKEAHIDQVSMWLSIHMARLPFVQVPANLNYYVHFTGRHLYFDPSRPILLLHYHDASLNVLGLIEPRAELTHAESEAVARANAQIRRGFNNSVFWDLRYRYFPERGSGVGSRGENLGYKRELLRIQGIESAESVVDVGCGDLEVLNTFNLRNYVGVDQSETALTIASQKRPDWRFVLTKSPDELEALSEADWVLCFEVLIHEPSRQIYDQLVAVLSAKARRVLIVSGYDGEPDASRHNHMIYFHEPLLHSLERTARFRRIEKIGAHTDVSIYRCEP